MGDAYRCGGTRSEAPSEKPGVVVADVTSDSQGFPTFGCYIVLIFHPDC